MHAKKIERIIENDIISRRDNRIFYKLCSKCEYQINIYQLHKIGIVWNNSNELIHMNQINDDLIKDADLEKDICNTCLIKKHKIYINKYLPYYTYHADKIIRWWHKVKFNPSSPYANAYIIISSLVNGFKLENYKLCAHLLNYNVYHVIKNIMNGKKSIDSKQDIIRDILLYPSKNIKLMHVIKYANIKIGTIKLICKSLIDISIMVEYMAMSDLEHYKHKNYVIDFVEKNNTENLNDIKLL